MSLPARVALVTIRSLVALIVLTLAVGSRHPITYLKADRTRFIVQREVIHNPALLIKAVLQPTQGSLLSFLIGLEEETLGATRRTPHKTNICQCYTEAEPISRIYTRLNRCVCG